jgi:hypothetical protein
MPDQLPRVRRGHEAPAGCDADGGGGAAPAAPAAGGGAAAGGLRRNPRRSGSVASGSGDGLSCSGNGLDVQGPSTAAGRRTSGRPPAAGLKGPNGAANGAGGGDDSSSWDGGGGEDDDGSSDEGSWEPGRRKGRRRGGSSGGGSRGRAPGGGGSSKGRGQDGGATAAVASLQEEGLEQAAAQGQGQVDAQFASVAWVQCDACQKWRRMPFGYQLPADLEVGALPAASSSAHNPACWLDACSKSHTNKTPKQRTSPGLRRRRRAMALLERPAPRPRRRRLLRPPGGRRRLKDRRCLYGLPRIRQPQRPRGHRRRGRGRGRRRGGGTGRVLPGVQRGALFEHHSRQRVKAGPLAVGGGRADAVAGRAGARAGGGGGDPQGGAAAAAGRLWWVDLVGLWECDPYQATCPTTTNQPPTKPTDQPTPSPQEPSSSRCLSSPSRPPAAPAVRLLARPLRRRWRRGRSGGSLPTFLSWCLMGRRWLRPSGAGRVRVKRLCRFEVDLRGPGQFSWGRLQSWPLSTDRLPPPKKTEASRRVYLSGATLVVVPGTLIPHWRQQISQHVKKGLLRVAVLDSSGEHSAAYEAHELAWNYHGGGGWTPALNL